MNVFLPYQRSWIDDTSRIKIMEKSRQIGLSWVTAFKLVHQHTKESQRLDSWVSSTDAIQARLFLEDCRKWSEYVNPLANSSCAPHSKRPSSLNLPFTNKTSIHCLSSNPNAQAGKRGSRILDEFALHPDPHTLYSIAYPGITWGGQLEIISTHRGAHNFFNQLIQEIVHSGNPKKISHHRVTLQTALDQGFLLKLKNRLSPLDPRYSMDDATYFDFIRNGCPDHESFMQEYMCEPLDESSLFLPPSLIDPCQYPSQSTSWEYSFSQAARSNNDFFLGLDIGRDHDLTVFCLLENINDVLFTRQLTCLQNTPFHSQEEVLDNFLSIPNLRRICIDQTGLGRQFTERAINRYGQSRIQGINFTNTVKESLAFSLRSALENLSIRFPCEKLLRADLTAIKRKTTLSGNIRFACDRGKNGHADRFWALSLAIHAAQQPTSSHHFISIPKPSRSHAGFSF